MKKFIGHFIKYPVVVNVMIIGFIIFGFFGYRQLNASFFPLAEPTFINISVAYPGASPEEVEKGVIEKIENNLKGIEGIDRVSSVSSENLGTISIEIITDVNINLVVDDVKNAIDRIASFPASMEPPVIEMVNPTRDAITFVLTGKNIPLRILKREAEEIENDLLRLENVSQVKLSGFPEEEIAITLSEELLQTYRLTFDDVAKAVAESNILITGGSVKTKKEEYLIRAENRDYAANLLRDIVVKSGTNGEKVILGDIATLQDTFKEDPDRAYLNNNPAIVFSILNTNSEDLIESADEVKDYITTFNKKHENLKIEVTFDSSQAIKDRIALLFENAIVGMLLVLLLLSFFLRPGIALWVAFGLPISFLGMFVLLPSYDVTVNMLSLFGMILVIGILVDDSIVISENIYSRFEKGDSPIKAAVNGTLEVMTPILAAITTTILAFSIFFFLDGLIGTFFGDIATVVTITLLVSLIEALIILPAHLAHSRDLSKKAKTYKINEYGDRFMNYLKDKIYAPALRFSLQHKFFVFSICCFLFLLTIGAFASGIIKLSFFPSNASDQIVITLETPQGTSETVTDSLVSIVETKVWNVNDELGKNALGDSHILNTLRRLGPGSSKSSITVNLAPSETRDISSTEIASKIRTLTGNISLAEKLSFNSGANVGGMPVSVSLQGKNIDDLKKARTLVYEELKQNPDIKDITNTSPEGIKEIKFELNEKAALLGLSLQEVMQQVRNAFFGREIQRLQRGENEVKVWVRYDRKNRSSINDLNQMEVTTSQGRIPLSELTNYTIERGEVAINHLQGLREIKIEADLANPKASAAEIMRDLQTRVASKVESQLSGVVLKADGQNREVSKITDSIANVFPAILFLIYMVIVIAFRSYSQPFILLSLVPFCLIGVAFGHWLHGFSMSILSYLGIIGLIGIVVNDGLVFTEKFNDFLRKGLPFDEALFETGKARFRAIFLTSITTIAGLAPLMLEKSLQAQFLIPMAIAISYGIAVATLLTLFILPIFLSFSNSLKVYTLYLLKGNKPTRESVERAVKELNVVHEEI
ncbi:efflux RND transporter permease subunit [Flavobacteriaceae bacterium M23B6Z8]